MPLLAPAPLRIQVVERELPSVVDPDNPYLLPGTYQAWPKGRPLNTIRGGANPTEGILNEGKDWLNAHTLGGSTVDMGLLHTVQWGQGTIVETSTLAGLNSEENGTGYAKISFTFPATVNGIAAIPTEVFSVLSATNWHTDESAVFLTPHGSNIGIWVGDFLSGGGSDTTFNMGITNSTLTIPSFNWFYANVFNP